MRLLLRLTCLVVAALVLLAPAAEGLHGCAEEGDPCAAAECRCPCHVETALAAGDAHARVPTAGTVPPPAADILGAGILLSADIFRPPVTA